MGLFHDEIVPAKRAPVSTLAVVSLIIAVTGFLNIVGFLVAPVLAHVSLARLKGTDIRGRRLAIAALWISYGVVVAGAVTLLVIIVSAYMALPSPPTP